MSAAAVRRLLVTIAVRVVLEPPYFVYLRACRLAIAARRAMRRKGA